MDYKAMFKDYERSVSEIAEASRKYCKFDMCGNVLDFYLNKETGNIGFEEHADRNSSLVCDSNCFGLMRAYHPMTIGEVKDALEETFYFLDAAGMEV